MKLFLKLSLITTLLFFCLFYNWEMNANEKMTNTPDFGTKVVSVWKINEIYRVDSAFIKSDKNKRKLLVDLIKADLEEKIIVKNIPAFIMKFLDSKTNDKHFFIANPGEEWQTGVTAPLAPVQVKMYDTRRNDSVLITQLCCKKLPDKSLAYFGIGKDIAAITYYSGGMYTLQNVILLKFEGETITDLWYDSDSIFGKTKADLVRFMKGKRMRGRENQNGC